jgi:ComF family protein
MTDGDDLMTDRDGLMADDGRLPKDDSGLPKDDSGLPSDDSRLQSGDSRLKAGDWRLKAGDWRLKAGDWRLKTGAWRLTTGAWRLTTGAWRLTTGDWRLTTGDWRLTTVRSVRRTLDALLSVILAPSCAACGELLERPTDGPVCLACWQSILPITPPLCDRCGDPLPTWRAISVPLASCPRCRRMPRAVDRARAVGEYDGALRAIVHALKYEGRRSLARPLGALMQRRGADVLAGAACAVPVPLHRARRRQRGFNQAADLARRLGVPVVHAVRRVRATSTQTGLPAARRHRNMRAAFAITRVGRSLAGAVVVLVDDVSTTGATLDACARVLKQAGVAEVRAIMAARVVTRRR